MACECKGTREERMKNWSVTQFMCNHSAFSGYRYTPSDYSAVSCSACHRCWRTKAKYVSRLPMHRRST